MPAKKRGRDTNLHLEYVTSIHSVQNINCRILRIIKNSCTKVSQPHVHFFPSTRGSLPFPSDNQLKRIFKHDGIDIHIIAIQESWPSPDESELLFQTSLGPGFVLFHSVTFGTLHLCIFLRRELVWYTCGMCAKNLELLFSYRKCEGMHTGAFNIVSNCWKKEYGNAINLLNFFCLLVIREPEE